MNSGALAEAGLPDRIRAGIEEFTSDIERELGDAFISAVLFGSAARKDYSPGSSDVSVMVVVKDASVAALDKLVVPLQKGVRSIRLAVMVLTEEDLKTSTDVFPIKFMDMKSHHRLLAGRDVLQDLSIPRDHLRLRAEQEIKNLLLRLRAFYLQCDNRPEMIRTTLAHAGAAFLHALGAALVLKGKDDPGRLTDVAEAASKEFELDGACLKRIIALRSEGAGHGLEELKSIYNAFMEVVHKAARLVDRM